MQIKSTKIGKYFILLLLAICQTPPVLAKNQPDRIQVIVSIEPQAYFVKRIGGNRVKVGVLILPGKSPATYSPTPSQVLKLSKAKIFFRIGVEFEKGLLPKIEKIAKQLQIVDTRKGIKLKKMRCSHLPHNECGTDPHIWLNPRMVKQQALTICNSLIRIDPAGKSHYLAGLKSFLKDLDVLDNKIAHALAPLKGSTIFVFHPAFGYFADAYGLKQMAVELEGKAPKGKELSFFIKKAIKEHVHVIFVQPQFDKRAARKVADAVNCAVVSIDPLAHDYIRNLEDMAEKVAKSLGR